MALSLGLGLVLGLGLGQDRETRLVALSPVLRVGLRVRIRHVRLSCLVLSCHVLSCLVFLLSNVILFVLVFILA